MIKISLLPKSAYARNILAFVLFNVGSIAAILGFVYFSTVEVIENEVAEVVEAEIRSLEDEYRAGGLARLRTALSRRVEVADGDAIYLLSAPNNQRIVGNLSQWPDIRTDGEWTLLSLYRTDTASTVLVGARAYTLGLGAKLLVGRDMRARRDFQETLTEAMIWALIIVVILALIGGVIFSRLVLRRLKSIDTTARSIMDGDISQRIPLTAKHDEFDQLAMTLNEMLGKVEDLIEELKIATESMAHDLRSPLTRLRSHLEQSQNKLNNDPSAGAAIEQAIVETDRILKDLNSLLNIARLETGLSETQMKNVDLSALLTDVYELYSPLAEENGMGLALSIPQDDIIIKANAQLIAQAISNLIENSIKYAGEGAKINISAEKTGGSITVNISDNGPGISKENRDKAIQRFIRLSPERKSTGMGLGLYLVSIIVKIHKFELKLDDNAPGLSTKIIIPCNKD